MKRTTRLAQAFAEFGRIDKTLHTLTCIDDENQRRCTLIRLNLGEGRATDWPARSTSKLRCINFVRTVDRIHEEDVARLSPLIHEHINLWDAIHSQSLKP